MNRFRSLEELQVQEIIEEWSKRRKIILGDDSIKDLAKRMGDKIKAGSFGCAHFKVEKRRKFHRSSLTRLT